MLTLGQIKLYMGPVNKNPKKKNQIFDFEFAKLDFCRKNASAKKTKNIFITLLCISKEAAP